jgi:hypothetical protein
MIKKIALLLFLVFVGSFDDFAWPADWSVECADVVRISDLMETPMGRTVVEISVVTTGEAYGGDASCANVAWCIRKLFDLYPKVLRVEIMNPTDEWVPSQWRSIDLCHAQALNEPWEEYGLYDSADDFLADCYEVQYPDKIDLVWHD